MHLAAGEAYGREATCGNKIDYKGEERASQAATTLSAKYGRDMEGYPCFFCGGWHIGRAMTPQERESFMPDEEVTPDDQ